jgi:hypothetical protein
MNEHIECENGKKYLVSTISIKVYNDKTGEVYFEWGEEDGECPDVMAFANAVFE